ncbi:hypothetical protein [Mesomycoplasma hyopneumoniae]|uniref:hypothetical protein n=1 Tax=Mesomycoplasma hyopneumoniae TaxID=2099 RepID=UPI003DA61796
MNKKYDIEFIKKELNYLKKHHNKKFTKTYEIYKYKFGNPENYGEYPNTFAEFLAKNENNAFFQFQTQGSIFTSYSILNQKLFFPSKTSPNPIYFLEEDKKQVIEKEVERLDSKTIQKWINRLSASNCDFDGRCENEWVNLGQIKNQLMEEMDEIYELEQEYYPEGFDKAKHESPEEKEKMEKYLDKLNNIIDFYENDYSSNFKEEIEKNEWVHFDLTKDWPSIDEKYENAEWAKNDKEVLVKILLDNKPIIKGHIDTAYSAFSRLEPLSNFNLVDSIIQKHWKDYPDFFEFNNEKYGFEKLATDLVIGKLKTKETEILGFRSETDTLNQAQKETKKLKMKI